MKQFSMGLMSGTSVDSIDAALVQTENGKDQLLLHMQHPYEKKLRAEILELIRNQSISLATLTRIHYEIGEAFAKAAQRTIQEAKRKKLLGGKKELHAIGAHGQTVFHDPEGKRTLQIGEGAIIAARTGITTVSDLRMGDTAQGGEGAPLLPFYHRRLFQKELRKGIVVHNLGGISNFTYSGPKKIFALDTGPANCLLDGAIQVLSGGRFTYDKNGALARSGRLDQELLSYLMNKPDILAFRKRRAPKSTGRELFSPKLLEECMKEFSRTLPEDLMRTLAQFTCELIVESYKKELGKLPLHSIVFAGGGAKNTFLLELLQTLYTRKNIRFCTMEDYGWNSQALEAQAFGVFALMALKAEPITFPSTTGAKEPAVCGKINPSKNWKKLRFR